MRQITASEKIDPLARIQEEIKEVVRREEEYRQLKSKPTSTSSTDYESCINNSNNNYIESSAPVVYESLETTIQSKQDDPFLSSLTLPSDSSPLCVENGKMLDDSNDNSDKPRNLGSIEQRYIGPNCYNLTPEPPQQKLLDRNISASHFLTKKSRPVLPPAQKGVMRRFIASRGKVQLHQNTASNFNNTHSLAKGHSASASLHHNVEPFSSLPDDVLAPSFTAANMQALQPHSAVIIPSISLMSSAIERDSSGKPIRRGYIPVEVKIQQELNDLKSRESELRKIRKTRQSSPDLLNTIDDSEDEIDDENAEHCLGPGKLRTARSISELCTKSLCNTPNANFETKMTLSNHGMRPAMSLAQLCDLDPKEAPSSHLLIAQWESLIQQNA